MSVCLLHSTSSSETNTGNIFLRHNRAVSSTVSYHLAGNILDEVKAKKRYIWPAHYPGCFWMIFDKMAPEETDFERKPSQKQFRVTRNS